MRTSNFITFHLITPISIQYAYDCSTPLICQSKKDPQRGSFSRKRVLPYIGNNSYTSTQESSPYAIGQVMAMSTAAFRSVAFTML